MDNKSYNKQREIASLSYPPRSLSSGCLFANLIIQFFVKMNNLYTLRFWIYIVGSEPFFVGEKSGVVGKVVYYYWIIESAKKWIMECVNEQRTCKLAHSIIVKLVKTIILWRGVLNIFFGMFGALFLLKKGVSIHVMEDVCWHIYGM